MDFLPQSFEVNQSLMCINYKDLAVAVCSVFYLSYMELFRLFLNNLFFTVGQDSKWGSSRPQCGAGQGGSCGMTRSEGAEVKVSSSR